MRMHIIKATVRGMAHHYNCPYCGMFSLEPRLYESHMNKEHSMVGTEWKLELVQPRDMNAQSDAYWIIQEQPKAPKQKVKKAKK
jgi:uncharacterized C2H2 Zn-finger protein